MTPKVITRKALLAKQARAARRALAVYFFTGVFPTPLPSPSLRVSSASITPTTLYACQQSSHRR